MKSYHVLNHVEIKLQTHVLQWGHDPGGYWWPPAYSTWIPSIVSFSFPVSLIVAQFTIFYCFRVLNFWSRFEALNDIFSASNGWENMSFLQS